MLLYEPGRTIGRLFCDRLQIGYLSSKNRNPAREGSGSPVAWDTVGHSPSPWISLETSTISSRRPTTRVGTEGRYDCGSGRDGGNPATDTPVRRCPSCCALMQISDQHVPFLI